MNKYLLYMFLALCTIQQFHSQEESNGVVALALPVRNSLKYNRYAINPTFSFVREQNKYISFTNKKQWTQFNDAPQSYLFSYSGRFSENIGAGVGLFQQDFGVLTTFGGIFNFAYNANISRESNLTFGFNIGAYQSRLNAGRVIVNTPDPSLQNVPSNFLITVNPGINYGTDFFDFGVAINNLVSYNLNESQIIEDNPEQAVQAHVMYTGYMNSRGFFDESRFSTLIRSEFKKDQTIISGLAMLNVPKGIWAQAGYNTLFGASAGLGINVTNNIAIEYNYEQSMGDFYDFGSSHEITLAYRFNKNYRYSYGDDKEEQSVFNSNKKRKSKSNSLTEEERTRIAERRAEIAAQRKATAEAKAEQVKADKIVESNNKDVAKEVDKAITGIDEQEKLQQEVERKQAEEQARLKTKNEARKKLKLEKQKEAEAARLKAEKERRLKLEADKKAKAALEKVQAEEAERKALEVERLQQEKERKRIEEAAGVKAEEEARQKLETERLEKEALAKAKAEEEEEARLKLEAKQKAKEALEKAKAEEAERLQQEAKRKRIEDQARLKAEEERKKIEAETLAKAKAEAQEKARLQQEQLNAKKEVDNADKEDEIPVADDEASKTMNALVSETTAAKKAQDELMKKLSEKIAVKQKDLDDLKEENDLSEKGIYLAPKPFKSLSTENAQIAALKDEIGKVEKAQEIKMIELEALLIKRKRKFKKDAEGINQFYLNALGELKADQLKIKNTKESLMSNLDQINEDTDFERKRRIRRAAYDNQQDRYNKDKAALERIKKFTDESTVALQEEDFDFGEEQTKNIQIIKNVLNEEPGYYMVIAVHNSVEKRDEFVEKVVASGEKNVNFFFDVTTNKYFIYYEKFDSISQAKNALDQKGSKPYTGKMSLVKINN